MWLLDWQQELLVFGWAFKLLDDDIDVELTATERVGVHHYKFNNAGKKYVILDLKHRDEVIESSILPALIASNVSR